MLPIVSITRFVLLVLICVSIRGTDESTAEELIAKVLDQTRGLTSFAELTMTINRPEWQRTSTFVVWTKGRQDALIRFTAPPRNVGLATLRRGDRMWTYSPKIQRTVRLPKSMMSQDWAGSDFSYNDLARSDELLNDYQLSITDIEESQSGKIYTVEALPKENAAIVWGKEEIQLREDFVLLKHSFFDQDHVLVKWIETIEIAEFDDREIPSRMRVQKVEDEDSWTEIEYVQAEFDIDIDDSKFTLFELRANN